MAASPRDPPERIVCLTEEPTEILYRLGEERRIVGISAWTERPTEAKRDKPVVSAFTGGSVEKIVALRPDLVVGFSDVQADLAASLIRAQLPVLIFNQRSLVEILDVILVLGRIVGAEAKAKALVEAYRARLAAVRRASEGRPRPRVYFEEWPDPMLAGSWWISELIEVAGGDDVFADRARGRSAKERAVTADEVIARAPEVMLASWCGKPFDRTSVLAREGWADVPALAEGRVHEIPASIILQPGPAALTDGLDALVALLVPAARDA